MIRDATPTDCDALSALAFAAKAFWGYDDAFMEACRDELTVTPNHLDRVRVRVYGDDTVEGFAGLDGDDLVWLFVAPCAMRRGIGRALLGDACALARAAGVETLRIEADPNAVVFYERVGAVCVGDVPSVSIPGRVIPLYRLDVSSMS